MILSDRDEFETVLGELCAGFGVPLTVPRREAFWTGLKRMSLPHFRRCAELALSEENNGHTSPTTGLIWRIYRGITLESKPTEPPTIPADQDHLAYLANRLLWLHVSHRGGLGSDGGESHLELRVCIDFVRRLVWDFMRYVREGDDLANLSTFASWFLGGLKKISIVLPRTERDLQSLIDDPESQKPFASEMARDLGEAYLRPQALQAAHPVGAPT